jgi:hypothetical protein
MLFIKYDQRILIDLWFETCARCFLSHINLAYLTITGMPHAFDSGSNLSGMPGGPAGAAGPGGAQVGTCCF